jgi:hypothetical protein
VRGGQDLALGFASADCYLFDADGKALRRHAPVSAAEAVAG